MNRNKSKNIYYLIIGLYGITLLAIMLGIGNLYGSTTDWLGQHVVFPDLFRRSFYESKQLIPNFLFQIGGGQNAFLFTYYGFLSPVILISYLLPFIDMTAYVIGASIILYLMTGILVFVFLKRHFSETKALASAILFLTLSPVNYHFHHHIMFVWYLPFLMMGLIGVDHYFEKKKRMLFIVSTFCLILTNYYFSVGSLVCLFVYTVYNILEAEKCRIKDFFRQFWSIVYLFIIPVLLSAFVLLPTAYALFSNSRSFAVSESIENLLVPNLSDIFFSHFGMGITGLMLVAVIGNLTSKRLKKCEVFFNGFLIFIVICPLFTYVLNGMLYVRGKVLIPFAILFVYAFCMFIEKLEKQEIAVLVFLRKPMLLYAWTIMVLLAVSFVNQKSEQYVSVEFYEELHNDEIEKLMEYTEDEWYRTNVAYFEKHTANKMYGDKFYGSSVYSSTSNRLYQDFYETYMGNNERYRNCFITSGAMNELFYTFMGTRYMIGESDPGLYYEKIAEGENLNLYENQAAYPIAYKSSKTMSEADFDQTEFPYSAEYLMTHTVVDNGDSTDYQSVIEKCDVAEAYQFIQDKSEIYEIELAETYRGRLLYLTFDIVNEGNYQNKKDVSISINGVKNKLTAYMWQYYNGNTKFDYVIPLENTTTLTVEITKGLYDIQNLRMYTSPIISTQYPEAEHLEIDTFSGEITCSVSADDGDYLVTSIPFDKGFTAYVNGEPAAVEVVNKAFVGVRLNKGENDVVIKYTSPFFHAGLAVSLLGFALLLYELLKTKVQKFMRKNREIVMYLIFGILTTVVSLFSYFLCTTLILDADNAIQLQVANVISWMISVTFAYVTNKIFVFQSQNSVGKEIGKFYASRLGTLLIDMALMYLLVTLAGISDIPVKIVVQAIVIVSNYVLGKFLVFGEGKYK
ncbi:MAG: YfhO family protein [Tyzzerella sp.]|nr:YfhO family protein [Tyzzerella sp.]